MLDTEGKIDIEGLARILENLFLKPTYGKFTTRDVVVNLPEAKCFVRVIHVASMSDAEIDAAVPFEAESYIPVPVDQVYLDWQRLEEVGGRVALLLVASPKVFVDQVLAAVAAAGLTCTALEVESQGLTRCLLPEGEAQGVLIANLKAGSTDLVMTERGNIQFTSTIAFAGSTITEAIAKGVEVPPARAEEIKLEAGFGSTEEYPNLKTVMVTVMNSLSAEIKQVMVFHDQHSTVPITRLLLVGGGARLKHLPEFLKESFADRADLVVELGDPTINIKVELPEQLKDGNVLPFAAAIGLALEGLTL
jgi:type IV pilus assembly protein PilM